LTPISERCAKTDPIRSRSPLDLAIEHYDETIGEFDEFVEAF
jgi:hypothetical protein